jgi:hypothetical protein
MLVYKESKTAILLILEACDEYMFYMRVKAISL